MEITMGRMKSMIPDNYSCDHYLDVDECIECSYLIQTAHYSDRWRPTMSSWYNKLTKNVEDRIREYFKKKKKKEKVEIPF